MPRLLITAAAVLALSAAAHAQTTTTTTTTVTQETAPATVVVPGEVRTYVTQQEIPSVVLEGPVTVGEPLPSAVEYHVIPDQSGYAYAIVNGKRLIVDTGSRRVLEVYD